MASKKTSVNHILDKGDSRTGKDVTQTNSKEREQTALKKKPKARQVCEECSPLPALGC